MKQILKKTINIYYDEHLKYYNRLGKNLLEAINSFLTRDDIQFLNTSYRIKTIKSIHEKIERKKYKNPIEEIEDVCGIRIICYYLEDIERIKERIESELIILESEDKTDSIFGYRSYHIICKVPESWEASPNYRELGEYKVEIQIRTVLMHSWAEIEHKLSYKKKEHIDEEMREEFSILSASLKDADKKFQALKTRSNEIQDSLRIQVESEKDTFKKLKSINLDSLIAYLEYTMPKRVHSKQTVLLLIDELIESRIDFKTVDEAILKTLPFIEKVEYKNSMKYSRSGIVRMALNLESSEFWKNTLKSKQSDLFAWWIKEMETYKVMYEKEYL